MPEKHEKVLEVPAALGIEAVGGWVPLSGQQQVGGGAEAAHLNVEGEGARARTRSKEVDGRARGHAPPAAGGSDARHQPELDSERASGAELVAELEAGEHDEGDEGEDDQHARAVHERDRWRRDGGEAQPMQPEHKAQQVRPLTLRLAQNRWREVEAHEGFKLVPSERPQTLGLRLASLGVRVPFGDESDERRAVS